MRNDMTFENKFLNFLKGIGCMCVVFIHFPFPGTLGLIIKRLSFFAVPIFFMISGYFSYSKDMMGGQNALLRRGKKIFKITLLSCGGYFLYVLFFNMAKHNVIEFLGNFFSFNTLVDFVIVNNFEIIDAYHLWFLPSLLYAYGILYLLQKRNLIVVAYKFLPILFAIKLITEVIVETLGISYHWRCNVIIGAIPYVLLGNYIAYKQNYIDGLKNKNEIIGMVFSVLSVILLTVFDVRIGFWWVFIAILSILLFLIAVKNPDITIIKVVRKIGIECSLCVYVFHVIIYRVVSNIFLIMGLDQYIIIQWMTPIIVIIFSILWAMTLNWLVKQKRHLLN